MTDIERCVTTSSGVAVLTDSTEQGLRVRGVALGEGDLTYGNDRTWIEWPRETLEPAVSSLIGKKIVDPSAHWAPEGGDVDDEYPREPPEETWVGEITDARYEDGVGVLYEGIIEDESVAAMVEAGDVEPSPTVFHKRAPRDEDEKLWRATGITGWRDLAMVDEGASPSASIEATSSSGVAAMSGEDVVAVLSSAFEADDARTDDPRHGGRGEDPADADADADAATVTDTDNSDTDMDFDISDEEIDLVRTARTLESPTVVDETVASLGDEAAQYDEPEMLESSELEELTTTVNRIKGFLGELLVEEKGLKEDTVSSLSASAMIGEFEDDEGEIAVAVLEQNPETGTADEDVDEPDASDADDGADAEEIEEQVAVLEAKRAALANTSAAKRIDEKIAALQEGN